jgi:hypothetical protein
MDPADLRELGRRAGPDERRRLRATHRRLKDRIGKPLEASSKEGHLAAVRRFFTDCQEWEWLPRRFDPLRALATPRSIAALLGPNPRVIADEIWAKLLWAGLNLDKDDLPVTKAGHFYPLELVRAVTMTWLLRIPGFGCG